MKNNKFKETIMRYVAILASTSAFLSADAQTQFLSQNKEDIQIYTAVLKHGIPSQSERILILEDSLVDTFSNNDENLAENLSKESGVSPRCFEEWSLKNRESTSIKFKISSELDISFLSTYDLDTLFNENTAKENWAQFNNLYKDYDGFIAISRIGYNDTKDQAVLLLEHHCGASCGTGKFISLIKTQNKWSVESTLTIWLAY
tara:strand:- start:310 stop:918 length:609 start_codon:yes stop_codon:yes gene_type:complete